MVKIPPVARYVFVIVTTIAVCGIYAFLVTNGYSRAEASAVAFGVLAGVVFIVWLFQRWRGRGGKVL